VALTGAKIAKQQKQNKLKQDLYIPPKQVNKK
jgi:hypothetical protein